LCSFEALVVEYFSYKLEEPIFYHERDELAKYFECFFKKFVLFVNLWHS
jgi:hypothetical protein